MSDAKGSSGAFEDLVSAHRSVNWEARLTLARKQRAKILAKVSRSALAKARKTAGQMSPEQCMPGAPPDSKIEEALSKRTGSDNPAAQIAEKKKPGVGLIASAALLCGIFLGLASSQISYRWQQVHAMPAPMETAIPDRDIRLSSASAIIGSAPSDLAYGFETLAAHRDPSPVLSPPSMVARSGPPDPLPVPEFNSDSSSVFDPAPEQPVLPVYAEGDSLLAADPALAMEVFLFVPARVSADARGKALDVLAGGRARVVSTARVGFSVKQTHVRYYHPDDAEKAMLAADALDAISRDFTGSATKTRPGQIEVYLAGKGGRVDQNQRPQSQPNEFEEFIASLLDELR